MSKFRFKHLKNFRKAAFTGRDQVPSKMSLRGAEKWMTFCPTGSTLLKRHFKLYVNYENCFVSNTKIFNLDYKDTSLYLP